MYARRGPAFVPPWAASIFCPGYIGLETLRVLERGIESVRMMRMTELIEPRHSIRPGNCAGVSANIWSRRRG